MAFRARSTRLSALSLSPAPNGPSTTKPKSVLSSIVTTSPTSAKVIRLLSG